MQEKTFKKEGDLKTPVRYLKGVGPKRSTELERLNIRTVEDLLYFLPRRYEDRSKIVAIRDTRVGEYQTIQGEIASTSTTVTKGGMPIFRMVVTDQTGSMPCVWFNQLYLNDIFRKGQSVVLYGKVEHYREIQIVQPEYEFVKGDESDSIHIGRIVPVYHATAKLTQRFLREIVHAAVAQYARHVRDRLPTYIIAKEHLVDMKFAVHNIHFPVSFENLEKAYARIVFEEFLLLQVALTMKKRGETTSAPGLRHTPAGEKLETFKASVPFELTGGQKAAIADIERDMSSGTQMNRLLEGDVGSGKTVVACHAIILTVENAFQAAVMAPTEVLARQHFVVLSELLMPLGISVAILAGGIDPKTREAFYSQIGEGKIDVVVGTHALIQEAVTFKRLGLAVIDEQHKFGVAQRAALKEKGYTPHILIMTATPIPRTLALTVYGDLDISLIKELPKGRKPIVTYLVEDNRRKEIYEFVREEISKGRQAYVVCPLIEKKVRGLGSGVGDRDQTLFDQPKEVQSAEEMFKTLKNEDFKNYRVGLLHGKMSTKEKDAIMKRFKKGAIDVLVATVVIEVGIDVANATVMVIENAERFGLSQLHQLRGRIGRGAHESYCILLARPSTDSAMQRLKAIEETVDGFEIAEADLDIRGPGEFFGTRQHGLPEIRFGNIVKDVGIMEQAKKAALSIITLDPDLKEERHIRLKESLTSRYKGIMGLLNVG